MKKSTERALTALCALVLLAAFLLTGLATWRASRFLLDGDTSSEMVLGKLLNEQSRLFSADWHYSTEIRVISTHLTTAPLFSLFSSWAVVRFLSMMIWHLLLLASWVFLGRQLGCSLRRILLGGAVLMLPFSVCYGRMVLFQGYYAPHIAVGFTLAGLFLLAMRSEGKKQPIALGLLAVMALAAGACGIRHLMNLAAPLGVAFLWSLAEHMHRHGEAPSALWKKHLKQLLPMILLGCCCLAGFLVYSRVLQPRFSNNRNYAERLLHLVQGEDLWPVVTGYLSSLGYFEGAKLFSPDGITGLMCALGAIALPGLALIRSREGEGTESSRFTARFFLSGMVIMVTVFLLVSSDEDYYPLYWLVPAAWAVPMLMSPMPRQAGLPALHRLIAGLCAAVLLVSGFLTLPFFLHPGEDTVRTYEGLEYQDTTLVFRLRGMVDFLTENGYDLGLGMTANAHWYTHVITEMTDGRIAMAICNNGIDRFLNDKRLFSSPEALTEHRFFAVVENADASEEFAGSPFAADAKTVYQDEWFTVLTWEDPVAVFGRLCVPAQ